MSTKEASGRDPDVKFLCGQMREALPVVARLIGRGSKYGFMRHAGYLCVKVEGGSALLCATQHFTSVAVDVPAKIDTPSFSFAVPARTFLDHLDALPDEEQIRIWHDLERWSIHLECGRVAANIKGIPPDPFDEMTTTLVSVNTFTLPPGLLAAALQTASVSAARDDVTPRISGVNLYIKGDRLVTAGTDGFRLSRFVAILDEPLEQVVSLTIPYDAVGDILLLLKGMTDDDEPIELGVRIVAAANNLQSDQRFLVVATDRTVYETKVIDDPFPEYEAILPRTTVAVTFPGPALLGEVRRANIFAREAHGGLLVSLENGASGRPQMRGVIRGQSSEIGGNIGEVDTIDHTGVGDEKVEFVIKSSFLMDALKHLNEPAVRLRFSHDARPILIEPVAKRSREVLHVIMPMGG